MTGERGSVLVEALVSTTIVAAAMAAMFTAVDESDGHRREIAARRMALMIARSELAAVGSAIPLRPGQVDGAEGDFVWRVRVEPGQADALDSSLVAPPSTVTVTVRAAAGGPDLAMLRTQLAAPSP
jgi:general secretion pathway protein I